MFEGRNPEGQDFYGIKQLLQQLFLKTTIDLSQLSDMLISQHGVGSVLKQGLDDGEEDDDDDDGMAEDSNVFGITSVINLTSHKETPCIQQLFQLFDETSKKYADKATQNAIAQILSQSNKLGLLINERLINIPAKISDSMLGSLANEIERIGKRDKSYKFDYFVVICKTWRPKGEPGSND